MGRSRKQMATTIRKGAKRVRAEEESDDDVPFCELLKPSESAALSHYERRRLAQIQVNSQFLTSLSLPTLSPKKQAPKKVAKRDRSHVAVHPARVSARIRQLPTPNYTVEDIEHLPDKKNDLGEAVKQGYCTKSGKWRGETFGEVDGVSVGTVFGAGDFQRLGRQEMMESGFFRPFVTPEWIDPSNGGCYSLILNNDNGLSKDQGDRVTYAGSGGRRRGQNRTAPQCFDQSWLNTTNAALKYNFEHHKPVRLIRGPKLRSNLSTAHDNGGYRYDGLYDVTSAEMKACGGKKLLTAIFTLQRCV